MYFEDIKLGLTMDIAPAIIEKQKMIDFARLYDNIPLHTDEEYAKTTIKRRRKPSFIFERIIQFTGKFCIILYNCVDK